MRARCVGSFGIKAYRQSLPHCGGDINLDKKKFQQVKEEIHCFFFFSHFFLHCEQRHPRDILVRGEDVEKKIRLLDLPAARSKPRNPF